MNSRGHFRASPINFILCIFKKVKNRLNQNFSFIIFLFTGFLFLLPACRYQGDQKQTDSAPTPIKSINSKCVQIFYDGFNVENDFSKLQGLQVYNLIGHFKNVDRQLVPISEYLPGQLDQCEANFYVGANYFTILPEEFLNDVASTKSAVAWLGYSFWQMDSLRLKTTFGVEFVGFSGVKYNKSLQKHHFFQTIEYKKEEFTKFFSANSEKDFQCACEISLFKKVNAGLDVLATAKDPITLDETPWAVRLNQKYLFSEIPFFYTHEADRYFIFADLIFDIVNENPLRSQPIAVIRLEDIHSRVSVKTLDSAIQLLEAKQVPLHLSVIPFFHDPYGVLGPATTTPLPATDDLAFSERIQKYAGEGQSIIWHGVTHQFENYQNPVGVSGVDYEFWDSIKNSALPGETSSSILQRLNEGQSVFKSLGLKPQIWLTPHYAASHLSQTVFAKYFQWTMGRIQYFSGSDVWATQIYPFEVYSDYYGFNVIPENLGYIHPERSVDDILKDAKRNLVLRDAWASFFIHPYLLDDPNFESQLKKLIEGLQAFGYKFIQIENEFLAP